MLRVLARRGLETGISLFALLGFCYVPLGAHTGLEHAKAVFSTPAAKRAGLEFVIALSRARDKLTGELSALAHTTPPPDPSVPPHPPRSHPRATPTDAP